MKTRLRCMLLVFLLYIVRFAVSFWHGIFLIESIRLYWINWTDYLKVSEDCIMRKMAICAESFGWMRDSKKLKIAETNSLSRIHWDVWFSCEGFLTAVKLLLHWPCQSLFNTECQLKIDSLRIRLERNTLIFVSIKTWTKTCTL